jgi:hypothetical protein
MHDNGRPARLLDPPVATDMIGVSMGGNDILNSKLCPLHLGQDPLFITAWINHRTLAGLGAPDNIAADAHLPDSQLFDKHRFNYQKIVKKKQEERIPDVRSSCSLVTG